MTARARVIVWAVLIWSLVSGVASWLTRKTEKVSAILIVSCYSAILVYGLFFKPKEELRREKLQYVGFALVLAFWLFLTYAQYAKWFVI